MQRAFYEDLFLMLAQTDRRQITAREVAEKHEEKLLMLGPVLERLHTELLDPLIDRTFNILQQNGVLPVPPAELQNRELNIEYVSVLAQAQRLVATGAVERLVGFAGQIAQLWPEARHKVDATQAIDEYAESLGVDPSMVRSDDEVMQRAQAEQQAQAQQQAMVNAQQGADIAKTASEANIEEKQRTWCGNAKSGDRLMANVNIGSTRNFTPDDATVDQFTMILVTTTSGDVSIDQEGGNNIVLSSVPTGVWIPVGKAIRIKATGTTAAGFLVV